MLSANIYTARPWYLFLPVDKTVNLRATEKRDHECVNLVCRWDDYKEQLRRSKGDLKKCWSKIKPPWMFKYLMQNWFHSHFTRVIVFLALFSLQLLPLVENSRKAQEMKENLHESGGKTSNDSYKKLKRSEENIEDKKLFIQRFYMI